MNWYVKVFMYASFKCENGVDSSTLFMELIQEYDTENEESSDTSTEEVVELLPNQMRSVYLVTYSQANKEVIPTRRYFAEVLVKSFQHVGAEVVQWCCSEEEHRERGTHYHVVLKLNKVQRWNGSKRYLRERHGITVNYSSLHHNYYSAWRYVTKSDDKFEESECHPDLKSCGEPRTSKASEKVRGDARKRRRKEGTRDSFPKNGKRKRLSAFEVSELMLRKNIRNLTELQALAFEQKNEGKQDLMEFLLGRSRKVIAELIDTTWEIKQSSERIARARKSRLEILHDVGSEDCIPGCHGDWIRCAMEVLESNGINAQDFGTAIRNVLYNGRGKYLNIMITGPANCGKTFILKPLTVIYDTFCNPASGTFAWIGVEDKECIFLNDFRWSAQLIPWHDLLLMLEGELVHLPAPKTHYSKDIKLVKDTPIFCTTKRPLLYVKNGMVDERESEMMAVRWKIIEFKAQIPEARQRRIQPCPSCFAKLVFC